MDKETFKIRWESNDNGGGITMEDVAKCAEEWGLYVTPRICPSDEVLEKVLEAAGVEE